MRRILIVVGSVIVILLIAAGIYFLFFANKSPGVTVGTGENPFGDTSGGAAPVGGEPAVGVTGAQGEEVAPHLIKITDGPVAYGSLAFNYLKTTQVAVPNASGTATSTKTATTSATEVRYAERTSGNLYAYDVSARTLTRLSNRTLPGIEEAAWTPTGSTAFLRFLSNENGAEEIDTYALPSTGDGGYFLEPNLSQVFVTGSSTLVTLLPSSTGSIATVAKTDGTSSKTLFSSALASLRLYPAGKGYDAATKASAQADGYAFSVGADGTFTRLLGPLSGLTILPSPSGKTVLYSFRSGNSVNGGLFDAATHSATNLPLSILPEKCVWTADEKAAYCAVPRTLSGTWPDSWYQGTTSFSDRIWKIDLASRTAILVVDPLQVGKVDVDAVSLAIDPKADVLVFTNRADGSLWMYDL